VGNAIAVPRTTIAAANLKTVRILPLLGRKPLGTGP
jgi:hypothetical protein